MNQGAPLTDSAVDESLQYSVLVVVVGFLFLCFFFFTISTTALLVYTCLYECIFVFIYLHVESKAVSGLFALSSSSLSLSKTAFNIFGSIDDAQGKSHIQAAVSKKKKWEKKNTTHISYFKSVSCLISFFYSVTLRKMKESTKTKKKKREGCCI